MSYVHDDQYASLLGRGVRDRAVLFDRSCGVSEVSILHEAADAIESLTAENTALRKDAERYRHVWDNWPLIFGEMLQNGYGHYPIENKAQGDASIDAAMEPSHDK